MKTNVSSITCEKCGETFKSFTDYNKHKCEVLKTNKENIGYNNYLHKEWKEVEE